MKRLYILLTLLVAAATNLAAQTDGYQPLVREGVRWIYAKTLYSMANIYAYEFHGDSIFQSKIDDSQYCYMKLYRYPLYSEFQSDSQMYHCDLLRESDKKVYRFPWDYNAEGSVIYDFSHIDSVLVAQDNDYEPYFSIPYISDMYIDNARCRVYDKPQTHPADYVMHTTVIEGVGFVGMNGDLLYPNPLLLQNTGASGIVFICLQDLEGNILYGDNELYQWYLEKLRDISEITSDGRVDIADLNSVINTAVGNTENKKADINGDGRVDIADINAVANAILNARK